MMTICSWVAKRTEHAVAAGNSENRSGTGGS